MGLFSSKERTTVGTTIQRVIEDKMLPDSLKSGAVQAIMNHSSQSVEYVMDELVSGMATRMETYYRYGKKRYTHGLPVGHTYSTITGKDQVLAVLQADVGAVSSIDYYKLGALNMVHIGWMQLVRDYQYNSSTNTLVVGGRTVYLKNIQPVVMETNFNEIANGSMDVWGTLPTAGYTPDSDSNAYKNVDTPVPFLVDATATADRILVTYCYATTQDVIYDGKTLQNTVVVTDKFYLPMTGYDSAGNYFQVKYYRNGLAGYWTYKLNSNVNPAVEAVFDQPFNSIGTFFPWAYFRFNKTPSNTNKTSQDYITTKRMLHTIGMDYDQLADNINENPDIKDVEQAMMMAAVPAMTTTTVERKYLFDFFSKMYLSAQVTDGAAEHVIAVDIRAKTDNKLQETTIVIQDNQFKMALSFTSIVKQRVAGKFGKVGEYTSGRDIITNIRPVSNTSGTFRNWETTSPKHYYRKQISDNVYEEVIIQDMKMVYFVFGEYTVTTDDVDDVLMVPLDFEITKDYEMFDRELLYARSLHYIFNSRIITVIKWYQQGWFRALLVIVSIVIMCINIGAGLKALSAALAAGATLTTIAYMVLVAVIKYIIITVAVRIFVKVVGAEAAFIAAIIAAAAGMYDFVETGSIAGAPWGKELLALSTNLTQAIQKEIESEFNTLRKEAIDFQKYKAEQTKLLETAQELLDGNVRLDPMILWGEKPDELYQRTVHSGNIGIVGIDAISSFVETKLMLPKLSDQQGDFV
jgi:hypothetical protein